MKTLQTRMAPGFTSPVEAQKTFRAILRAMSRPGRIVGAGEGLDPPKPLHAAFGAACLTLLDFETPLWADLPEESAALEWLRFHCGAPVVGNPRDAAFALITRAEEVSPLDRFDPGDEERPERAATVIVQVERIETGRGLELSGPGIEDRAGLWLEGLPASFRDERARMEKGFPLGLDFLFTANRDLAALPRTTRIGT